MSVNINHIIDAWLHRNKIQAALTMCSAATSRFLLAVALVFLLLFVVGQHDLVASSFVVVCYF